MKALIGIDQLFHVHLSTPLEVCRDRDQTGRYLAAEKGELTNFPGVSADYQDPTDADIEISMEANSVELAIDDVLTELHAKDWLKRHK